MELPILSRYSLRVIVSLAAWCFLEGIYQIQQELYVHLPHAVGYSQGPPDKLPSGKLDSIILAAEGLA